MQLPVADNKEAISRITEVAMSHQLTVSHLDVSDTLEKYENNHKKREKVYKRVDDWCNEVFNHVSMNGMCVVIFAGPKNIPLEEVSEEKSCDSSSSSLNNNNNNSNNNSLEEEAPNSPPTNTSKSSKSSKLILSSSPSSEADQIQPEEERKTKKKPRRNGVCFIRINAKKV